MIFLIATCQNTPLFLPEFLTLIPISSIQKIGMGKISSIQKIGMGKI